MLILVLLSELVLITSNDIKINTMMSIGPLLISSMSLLLSLLSKDNLGIVVFLCTEKLVPMREPSGGLEFYLHTGLLAKNRYLSENAKVVLGSR